MTFVPDADESLPADVVLHTSLLRFVRLVSGEHNAGLEYLSGGARHRRATPTSRSASAASSRSRAAARSRSTPASSTRSRSPPHSGRVKGSHLKKVMRSGFRPVVLGEIFRRLPDFVNPKRAARLDITVGFRLTGNPTGEIERYVVRIDHGTTTVTEGDDGRGPGRHRDLRGPRLPPARDRPPEPGRRRTEGDAEGPRRQGEGAPAERRDRHPRGLAEAAVWSKSALFQMRKV